MRGWADVGLWVAVFFVAKIPLHRPTWKTTFARVTQSQAVLQSFAFSSLSDQCIWEIRLFFIFRNSFLSNTTVSFTVVTVSGDEVWRCGENAQDCRAALSLKKFARADHHDILEKRRLRNADADSTRALESRRSDAVEFYWSQTSSTAPIFSLEI